MTAQIAAYGRLVADPQLKTTSKGTQMTMASMAVPLPCSQADDGTATMWLSVLAFGRQADALAKQRPVAYTTVLTMFGILAKKGFVVHRLEGRAFIYRAKITREQARKQALDHLLQQFFEGSPNLLAQHLLGEEGVSRNELRALRDKVNKAKLAKAGRGK